MRRPVVTVRPIRKPLQTLRSVVALALVATTASAVANPAAQATAKAPAGSGTYIATSGGPGRFPLVASGKAAPIVVHSSDFAGVQRVVGDLQADIKRVTNVEPAVSTDNVPKQDSVVIVGTIGKSPLIDGLVRDKKLNVSGIAGKWETTLEQVVQNPLPGVRRAFVIAGSDQRGTIFGAYDVSKQIGVSPWYWWDDVPAKHQNALYVLPGRHTQGTPAVKYRGFFINDENPDLGTWGPETFGEGLAPGHPGGFNHKLYEKMFEALLRLKGNYLWPAVWGRAFAEDDPQNHATASKYGVVMGTSHEAPMMRGIEEWNRHDDNGTDPYGGNGQWSFRMNRDAVSKYFRDGAKRIKEQNIEGVVTLGMRGPGDVGLPDGDAIPLMEDIISTQRQILSEEVGDLKDIPQVFTLYKEVQRYWDRGMRPPDDVTIVFADDNWGNMRKLPDQKTAKRAGGYGLYYHFDYVGGGRNYKWVDTANLANTWEQLSTSYKYGVDRLWMFNVGDMKNEELPLQFSLDYAWNPNAMPLEKLGDWQERYAAQNFGTAKADDIAEVLHEYGRLQGRRKPELLNRKISLDPSKDLATDSTAVVYDDQGNPYSLTNYQEHARVAAEWARLSARAEQIGRTLPSAYQDAYYQLVLYQVKATANLYAFRLAEFTNLLYAKQGRSATNDLAAETEELFANDLELADFYNNELANGKWHNWQLQPHIDYGDVARYGPNAPWQQPELNDVAIPDVIFPAIKRIDVPEAADMGVAIDGSDKWWPNEQGEAVLPTFSPYQSQPGQYIEVFNRGQADFDYQIKSAAPYVKVTPSSGRVDKQVRASVRVDWSRAPKGTTNVPLTVTGPDGKSVEVKAVVQKPDQAVRSGFVEANGYVSMAAGHYSKAVGGSGVSWKRLADIGRTGDGMTPSPVTAATQTPGGASPRLEYKMNLSTTGPVKVTAFLSPRNYVLPTTMTPSDGLKYAVSIDDGPPQIVNVTTSTGANDTSMNKQWERNTSDNTNRTTTTHTITQPGAHTLKFWMVDPTVILQNLVVDTGGVADSYLGPPESQRVG